MITLQSVATFETTTAARTASAARAWSDAASLWRSAITEFGATIEAMVGLGTALREQKKFDEADCVWLEALGLYPNAMAVAEGWAWVAVGRRDWREALRRWDDVCHRFPNERAGYIGKGIVLRELGRLAEAEELLSEATSRFPLEFKLALEHAMLAAIRRAWPEALERYVTLANRCPTDFRPVVGMALAMREMRRLEEAESLLSSSLGRFPDAVELKISHAWIPTQKREWPEAIARWDKVISHHPDVSTGYLGMGVSLRGAKLFGLADCFLQMATERFPEDAQLAAEYGWVPLTRQDWELAQTRWKALAEKHPLSARVQGDYGFALLSSGKYEEAEQVLTQAVSDFPNHLGVAINLARVSNARGNWKEALERWTVLQAVHPDNQQVLDGLGAARFGQSMSLADRMAGEPTDSSFDRRDEDRGSANLADELNDDELVKKFESIGENCEFGLFQRAVGAEPLGLLRFAGISPAKLVAAMNCDFDGVGTADYLALRDSAGEYVTSDTRFGMAMHTFIQASKADYDSTYLNMLRRLTFLRRKLLEDLKEGEKLFVYKVWGSLSLPEMLDLQRSVSRHGNGVVFIVRVTDELALQGTVTQTSECLIEGFIERHGYRNGRWDIPVESWLKLCRRAYDISVSSRGRQII